MTDYDLTQEQADKMRNELRRAAEESTDWFSEPLIRPEMTATVTYRSPEYCGPMSLKDLKKYVDDALEKGVPGDSEVHNYDGVMVEGIVFSYQTERVEKIECGSHIPPDRQYDLIIATHEWCEDE